MPVNTDKPAVKLNVVNFNSIVLSSARSLDRGLEIGRISSQPLQPLKNSCPLNLLSLSHPLELPQLLSAAVLPLPLPRPAKKASISSSDFPLVSGSQRCTYATPATHTAPYSENTPAGGGGGGWGRGAQIGGEWQGAREKGGVARSCHLRTATNKDKEVWQSPWVEEGPGRVSDGVDEKHDCRNDVTVPH